MTWSMRCIQHTAHILYSSWYEPRWKYCLFPDCPDWKFFVCMPIFRWVCIMVGCCTSVCLAIQYGICCCNLSSLNILRLKQNDHRFAGDIFILIFLDANCCACILFQISLKFIWRAQFIVNQNCFMMVWHEQATSCYVNQWWPRLMAHIHITLPRWVEYSRLPL